MKQISEFLTVRENILKNSIYNKLLIAYLCNDSESTVAYSVVKLNNRLKTALAEKGKNCRYAMSPIISTITFPKVSIGYKVDSYPTVWEHRPNIPKRPQPTSMLHALSKSIVKYYTISAAKTDKIFSNVPESFLQYLVANNVSPNFWLSGFAKELPTAFSSEISEEVIDKYYEDLVSKNNSWSIFNTILIKLVKHGKAMFYNEKDGELIIEKIEFDNQHLIRFAFKTPQRSCYYSVDCSSMNPNDWYTRDFALSLDTLAKFVD